jgi:starch synthase
MDILMVTTELSPYARVSRAGDAVAALTKALCQLEHRVTIAVPRHPGFEASGLLAARRLTPLDAGGAQVTVLDGQLPAGATLVLFDLPALFEKGGRQGTHPDAPDAQDQSAQEALGLFNRAAAALAAQRAERGAPFDVVHLHDWASAPSAALFAGGKHPLPTVLTVHDGESRGITSPGALAAFELPPGLRDVPDECREGPAVSLLALGARSADAVTSVSASVAADLLDAARFSSLSRVLAQAGTPVTGIASGLDYAVYNPATDSALRSRYDAEDVANKGSAKAELLRTRGLDLDPDRPLIVAIVDDAASGGSLVERSIDALMKNDVALFVLVQNDTELAERIGRKRLDFPDRLAVASSDNDPVVRRSAAAADLLLVPTPYEATGFLARVAQRYGAPPIVHGSGAHNDAVVDCDAELETGTGFVYGESTPEALLGACARGLSAYTSSRWSSLRRRVMRLDLAWDRPARRYVQVYRQAIAARAKTAAS